MEQVGDKNIFWYIKDLIGSFEVSLLDISNKFYHDYNEGIERLDEFTIIGVKGHLKSRQEKDMVVSTMWFEYAILKEPYSERKEAQEIQWHTILDQELSYKGTIKQLEKNFDVIRKKINKFHIFKPKHPLERRFCDFDEIEVDVKIGSMFHCQSTR